MAVSGMDVEAQSKRQLVERLQRAVAQLEGSQVPEREACSTGCGLLDRWFPGGGVRPGGLVEWLGWGEASGAGTLALLVAREACRSSQAEDLQRAGDAFRQGKMLVVLDRQREFYPPAAAGWGIDLNQVLVIRAATVRDEQWALDQVLRCPAVGAVWAPLSQLDERHFRRLQLAAEQGGGQGHLLRPRRVLGAPSWADLQLLVEPCVGEGFARRWRLRLTRCRGGAVGTIVEVELDERAGQLREVIRRTAASSTAASSTSASSTSSTRKPAASARPLRAGVHRRRA